MSQMLESAIGITEFREKIIQETLNQSTQIESDEEEGNQDHRLALSGKKVDVQNAMKKWCNKVAELMLKGLPGNQIIGVLLVK